MQVSISIHREAVGLMLTNLRVGDRVEDKKTHKRGRVTFVYSEPEFKDEVIEVLFDGRESPVDVLVDSVRKVSTKQS
jgi:ABC-type Zn2+ transport system substrate-binding protein/surface adhesin